MLLFSGDYFKNPEPNEDSGMPVSIKNVITFFPSLHSLTAKGRTARHVLPSDVRTLLRSQSKLIFVKDV